MGINIEWGTLQTHGLKPMILPVTTAWPDSRNPNITNLPVIGAVLYDCTAAPQSMNFTDFAAKVRNGHDFNIRLMEKIRQEVLNYNPQEICFLWDKPPLAHCRRRAMYETRYSNGSNLSLLLYNPATGEGVHPDAVITPTHMFSLSQLLASEWSKIELARYIFYTLWNWAKTRQEHIVFDTPICPNDLLCDGVIKCNKHNCTLCLGTEKIPRHCEADVLFLHHIEQVAPRHQNMKMLVGGTNDRDLLVVLSCAFAGNLAKQVLFRTHTRPYKFTTDGWVKPTEKAIGVVEHCHAYVQMGNVWEMFGGPNLNLLLTRLFILFLYKSDYCAKPDGLTQKGLDKALFQLTGPFIIFHEATADLTLCLTQYKYFIQRAHEYSIRPKTTLNAENLMRTMYDAFYCLVYYTAHHDSNEPDNTQFARNANGSQYLGNPSLIAVFEDFLRVQMFTVGSDANVVTYHKYPTAENPLPIDQPNRHNTVDKITSTQFSSVKRMHSFSDHDGVSKKRTFTLNHQTSINGDI